VLSNWEKQITDHVAPGHLSTYLYYGNNRSISAADLQKYDIVITTYQTITGEHGAAAQGGAGAKKKKVEGVLMSVPWKVSVFSPSLVHPC
jgi:SWI/SNF-related matrix-associated actin-dependent regulator of chromatin subfamily A3